MKKMTAIILTCVLIFNISAVSLLFAKASTTTTGSIIYVDDNGGKDYLTIQDAINAASNGDTIFVHSGIYYERITVDKSIILTGENAENTIIDGEHKGDVVLLSADGIFISGFTIQNGRFYNGLYIKSNYNTITENIMKSSTYGIYLWHSSHNEITKNKISNNSIGIYITSSSPENNISLNYVSNNYQYGITISDASDNNVIYQNSFIDTFYNNAQDSCKNTWYKGYKGNYWDDYFGIDADNNGIGDVPYNISGGSNKDRYPFMSMLLGISNVTSPEIAYVDDDFTTATSGWALTHFNKIQDGVNAVLPNGIVHVYTGIYYENVTINKPIDLVGESRDNTIVDGRGHASVEGLVSIHSDWVNISGFTFQNSGFFIWECINIRQSSHVSISGNRIANNGVGIKISKGWSDVKTEKNLITNNIIHNSSTGIWIDIGADQNIVSNNIITCGDKDIFGNCVDGIRLSGADDNTIVSNSISDKMMGIELDSVSKNNIFNYNVITDCNTGIQINDCPNTIIVNNTFTNNTFGIDATSNKYETHISGNTFSDNFQNIRSIIPIPGLDSAILLVAIEVIIAVLLIGFIVYVIIKYYRSK